MADWIKIPTQPDMPYRTETDVQLERIADALLLLVAQVEPVDDPTSAPAVRDAWDRLLGQTRDRTGASKQERSGG